MKSKNIIKFSILIVLATLFLTVGVVISGETSISKADALYAYNSPNNNNDRLVVSPQAQRQEIVSMRSLNSKTFKNSDGSYTMEAHIGHINYFDKLGSGGYKEINWQLQWDNQKRGWYFDTHSFRPFLPEYSDGWIEFRDLFDDKDQMIKYRAICNSVKGRLVDKIDGVTETNAVIYDNAFGEGIDLILYFTRSTLKKVVRVRDGYKKDADISFDFEVEFPEGKPVYRGINKEQIAYQLDLTKDREFTDTDQTLIGNDNHDSKEWFTYLRAFQVWDSDSKTETTKVKYFVNDGKKYLRKTISREFLSKSVGDVFTDVTTSYYAGAGDGAITAGQSTTFANARNGIPFEGAVYDATPRNVYIDNSYFIRRLYFPFNTSGIGIVTGASLNLKYDGTGGNTNNLSIGVIQSNQASLTVLTTSDWVPVNFTRLASDKTIASINTAETYYTWDFNTTGISKVNPVGNTMIAIAINKDIDNDGTGFTGANYRSFYMSEQAGTSNDPYLSVTYTPVTLPTVTTQSATDVTSSSATTNGNIDNAGGENCNERGFVWGTASHGNPGNVAPASSGYTSNWTETGSYGTGAFYHTISSLTPGVTYYFRACSHNSAGWSYGSELNFATSAVTPTVTTESVTDITTTTAVGHGTITYIGGAIITQYGVCWSESENPTTTDSHTEQGTRGTGSFISDIIGLTPYHTYHYRAYATNSAGTGYGEDRTFKTIAAIIIDWNNGNVQTITLLGDVAFSFSNGQSGGIYTLIIKQDGIGGKYVSMPETIKWPDGTAPTMNTSADAVNIINFCFDGYHYYFMSGSFNLR